MSVMRGAEPCYVPLIRNLLKPPRAAGNKRRTLASRQPFVTRRGDHLSCSHVISVDVEIISDIKRFSEKFGVDREQSLREHLRTNGFSKGRRQGSERGRAVPVTVNPRSWRRASADLSASLALARRTNHQF
ncbi:unnamed protein product [Euphydryas editha]|uniref:Uncharacterized protein n=1 Tax=Euphydryas editha TaxID=104508 RepID=A0AAU9U307_EUPED|nr:unnamed protein product [Euphydryas editha]